MAVPSKGPTEKTGLLAQTQKLGQVPPRYSTNQAAQVAARLWHAVTSPFTKK